MTKMLTSVRDLREVKLVVSAGCDWLDLKEPDQGALGAVELETLEEVVGWTNSNIPEIPISATIGDYWESPEAIPERVASVMATGVDYVKVGIFADNVSAAMHSAIETVLRDNRNLIVVCFAERQPQMREVKKLLDLGVAGVMIDTARKDSGGLLTHASIDSLSEFVRAVKKSSALCGLAGSLSIENVPPLMNLTPDYLGFRGAICDQAMRTNGVCIERLTALRQAFTDNESLNGHQSGTKIYTE
ncbi:MAG: (5-formylfuran-3-yl)methyl phosphate synthase [Gammaproteobacteria bacterium]